MTQTHKTARRLKISRRCVRQTFGKFDKFHTVATKPSARRPPKVTDREKRLTKLQQLRDDTASLVDFVRYVNTKGEGYKQVFWPLFIFTTKPNWSMHISTDYGFLITLMLNSMYFIEVLGVIGTH